MSQDRQEEAKRQLHKLLQEYKSNAGMAGFVCGLPVAMMPESEQERYLSGFCTAENIKILTISKKKLELARNLELDESEVEKVGDAILKLEGLIEIFGSYMRSEIDRDTTRSKVRSLLERPIPDTRDELIDSLSHIIETLEFLSSQDVGQKDEWERLLDCAQMYDALQRGSRIGDALQRITGGTGSPGNLSGAVGVTMELLSRQSDFLESYFKGSVNGGLLQDQFSSLSQGLREIWMDPA